MEKPDVDLSKFTQPEKTWFFERGDGMLFACNESEANEIMRNRTNWMRRDFKMLGVSDGTTYKKVKTEEKAKIASVKEEVKQLNIELTKYLKTLERFKFDELLEDTDPKVMRANELIKNLETKIDEKNDYLKNAMKLIDKKAFDAEFAKAKGNIEMPNDINVMTPESKDRDKILRALNR